jgi:hypothetical protein
MSDDVPGRPRDRRILGPRAVAVVGAVVAAAFAGCGGGGASSDATPATSSPPSTVPSNTTTTTTSTESTTSTGGGGSTTTAQVGQAHTPRQAVEAVLTSADPSKACGAGYVTEHYLEAAYGGHEGCVKAQSPKSAATSLGSDHSVAIADRILVTVRPSGGLYDGEKIMVMLRREDGSWKVDSLKSNAPVGP